MSMQVVKGGGAAAAAIRGSHDVLTLPVLVLNRLYQPVRITTVRQAMRLLFTGTARVLDESGELVEIHHWTSAPVREGDDFVPLVQGRLRVPRIVHLRRYNRLRRATLRLTRRNLMLRDGHQCQYCGDHGPSVELDIDHVLPRSRNGRDTWENLVTACQPCNRKKGRRTPSEANMPLRRPPGRPHWSHTRQLLVSTSQRYQEWEPFLPPG